MDLKTYIADATRRDALVASLGSSKQYLWQIAVGWRGRKASAEFARKIHAASGGEIGLHELRPDIWDAPAARAA